MNYEQVKYKLVNKDTNVSKWVEIDPKEWDNAERTLKRSDKVYGMFTEFSKNLIFTKDAAEFLKEAYEFKDIEAHVELYEYRFHPQTEAPFLYTQSVFDFSDYFEDDKTVKVPFKTGGLNAQIKSQLSNKFELDRLEALNENTIDALPLKQVALTSRDIFLISKFENTDLSKTSTASVESNAGNTRDQTVSIPLDLTSKSHEHGQYVFENSTGSETVGGTTMMFFLDSDKERELNIDLSTSFNVFFQQYEHVQWCRYQVCLTTYQNGNSFNLKERIVLSELNLPTDQPFAVPSFTESISASFKGTKTILEGESLALEILLKSDMYSNNNAGVRAQAQNITASIVIEEDSFNEDSQTQAVLMRDIGEKLLQIITGEKNRFNSETLSEGSAFENLAATTGFWIRHHYDKSMQFSLKDFFDTLDTTLNTGYTIEVINGVETLVLEDKKYFFQNQVVINLDEEVTDLQIKVEKKLCNASLDFGYKKGGDYEEAMGLDEYNVKSGFTLPITRVDTKYNKISPSRADAYAKEFARRKLKLDYPEEDTRYDKDNHLLDLKKGLGLNLEERTWEDDFEEAPTGVYSPNTATNLRLTPSQIEQRHQWLYGSGIYKHQQSKVQFSSSEANKELTLKEVGKVARKESYNLNVKDLERPRFLNVKVIFEHPVTHDINQMIYGKTNINNRLIPNYFFKVAYKHKGKTNYGYLMEYKKKDSKIGKFTLIKAI